MDPQVEVLLRLEAKIEKLGSLTTLAERVEQLTTEVARTNATNIAEKERLRDVETRVAALEKERQGTDRFIAEAKVKIGLIGTIAGLLAAVFIAWIRELISKH